MNLKRYRQYSFVIALLACTATVNAPAGADENTDPLRLTVSLVSPSTVSAGEPLIIHYDLCNEALEKMAIKMGVYGTTWCDVVVKDVNGRASPTIPDLRPSHPAGAYATDDVFLNGGGHIKRYIVATKYVSIERPGRYTLSLRVHLPYAPVENPTQETPDALAGKSGLVMTQEVTFPITVTQQDNNRLHSTAETLRQEAEKEQDVDLAQADLDALFSMPAPEAAASWRSLGLRGEMSSDAIADELAQLHSNVGVDILAQMLSTPGVGDMHISERLNELYNSSDTELRTHIKDVAAALGIEMPDKVNTSLAID